VACFALAGALQFAMSPLNTLLVLRGHTRTQSRIVWIEFALFAVASLVLVPQMHLLGLVWARIAASLANAAVIALSTQKQCHLPLASVMHALWRPLAGAVAMYFLVRYVGGLVPAGALQLVVGVLCGALFYSAWCVASWFVAGKPEGFESTAFDFLATRK
jgi:lipopolysaccharide exporter